MAIFNSYVKLPDHSFFNFATRGPHSERSRRGRLWPGAKRRRATWTGSGQWLYGYNSVSDIVPGSYPYIQMIPYMLIVSIFRYDQISYCYKYIHILLIYSASTGCWMVQWICPLTAQRAQRQQDPWQLRSRTGRRAGPILEINKLPKRSFNGEMGCQLWHL